MSPQRDFSDVLTTGIQSEFSHKDTRGKSTLREILRDNWP